MSPYAYDPDNLRVTKQQARSVERVQNSIATIIVLLSAIVALVFLVRSCEDEHRGWPSDAHGALTQK
jgi:hypothetical protein